MPPGMLPATLSAQHGYEVHQPELTLEEQGCCLTTGNMTRYWSVYSHYSMWGRFVLKFWHIPNKYQKRKTELVFSWIVIKKTNRFGHLIINSMYTWSVFSIRLKIQLRRPDFAVFIFVQMLQSCLPLTFFWLDAFVLCCKKHSWRKNFK